MTLIQLPVRNDLQQYQFRIDLDTSTYVFRLHFNNREGRWVIHIYSANNTHLLSTTLVSDWSLIGRFIKEALPAGRLFLLDKEGKGRECGQADLGNSHLLMYETAT